MPLSLPISSVWQKTCQFTTSTLILRLVFYVIRTFGLNDAFCGLVLEASDLRNFNGIAKNQSTAVGCMTRLLITGNVCFLLPLSLSGACLLLSAVHILDRIYLQP